MDLKWIQNDPKMILTLSQMVPNNFSPLPAPSPSHPRRQQKSLPGGLENKKKNIVDDFLSCFMKSLDSRYCLKESSGKNYENHENYSDRFPEGVQKRKSNNDDKYGHGQEKRRPSTLCRGGKIILSINTIKKTIILVKWHEWRFRAPKYTTKYSSKRQTKQIYWGIYILSWYYKKVLKSVCKSMLVDPTLGTGVATNVD